MLKNKEPNIMYPWYNKFNGKIIKLNNTTFQSSGCLDIVDKNTVKISEIPVGTWIDPYTAWLETLVTDDKKNPKKGQILTDIDESNSNNKVDITIKFLPGELQKLIKNDKLEYKLKLTKTMRLTNLHLYNSDLRIKKYNNITEILKDYYYNRINVYDIRKKYYTKLLENKMNLLKYKIMFINYVINGNIIVFENKKSKKKSEIIDRLEELKFPKLSNNPLSIEEDRSYGYITSIPLFALTEEEMAKLQDEFDNVYAELEEYKNTTVQDIWMSELVEFEIAYKIWIKCEEENENPKKKRKTRSKKNITSSKK